MCNYGLKCRMTFTGIDALTQHVVFTHRKKDRRKHLVSINTSLVNGCKCVQRVLADYGDESGTKTGKSKSTAENQLAKFFEFLGKAKSTKKKANSLL